jgi:Ca2+-binding RTX toxin-like protein
LAEIEEIRLNGFDPSGAAGIAGGDSFEIIGDFSQTSLRLNTITIDGSSGDDTVNITALDSAHRIVFNSNGGTDTVIGTVRPQDVIDTGASVVAPEAAPVPDPVPTDDEPAESDPVVLNEINGTNRRDQLIGTSEDDEINGLDGHDILVGLGGNDVIFGAEGNDLIIGSGGNDLLYGGVGTDRLEGGDGFDVLDGGLGNDVFIFKTIEAADGDTITGFEAGDRIDLSGIDAISGNRGDQAFTLVTGAASAAGQVVVSIENRDGEDVTVISGHVNGDLAKEDFKITIEGAHNLTGGNFIF